MMRRLQSQETRRSENGQHNIRLQGQVTEPVPEVNGLGMTWAEWFAAAVLASAEEPYVAPRWSDPGQGCDAEEDEDPTAGFLYEAHWDRLR